MSRATARTAPRRVFDEAYYRRYYEAPETRVLDPQELDRLVAFVAAYLAFLRIPLRRVLDIGCGLGPWRDALAALVPGLQYTGVEYSRYLCRRFGWRHGSVLDYRAAEPFDLVVCQGVLQYLPAAGARRAIRNLARLSGGALYLEVLTREDWDVNCDRAATDGDVYLRRAAWYRRALAPHFTNAGGGLFLPPGSCVVLYELEKAE